ncbi:isoleucine--tRNA ligase [Campylobacter lari]|uniref:Isoleucine--tRNA ligase n=1 Tax=Campylobacter lari (strain RM2100 / D67 / ATCC BAA-1060) TaxID=306263 RepID=SYI_CAMLR|nr:isoleucine--tRNA ligase [Campylobacter lari]B9KD44.1 RecName: Full=Isoleucine--tRNA ligase; AltName: Full=Isoleucyl-tRNA synthetase; Short=IleRS [Campylobacter lari RM2100]ACM64483.1 isoleucyl-tRNA synthetase [Campylobacter lari RM2100]EAC1839906.1 isoleucine--tRNA ligase [Campylobacter lari]EAH6261893.1 isoleucine--tRNA ligase [Campylobacter lari]EAH7780184.1 isoleucine--tRNA ligase [Campylobacter lari]EAH8419862.1 isoleucine--tRNA ligase [Campylobacter lari]
MDYKDTLLLPNTTFAMRANLAELEPKRFDKWFENNYAYEKMKQKRQGVSESFTLHDGPPYANGHLHIGHALNKILKDIIIKMHYFQGKKVRFTPGWDCHGLPIEQQVEVKLKDKKQNLSKKQIRELCREHAREFVNIQRDEFKSLGVIADWDEPYLTMKNAFEADIYKALCKIAKKGLLLERSKPVFWSWAAKSALAEAEVEYEEKEDYSIYVAFNLDEASCKKLGVENAKAVIWTTTPWTLPANQAISLNPNEKYIITKEGYIFAKALLENMINKNFTQGEIQKELLGSEFENLSAINPLNQRKSTLILGEHVLMDGGTGLVHTAPGHGEDDYYACLKYNIEVIMPVDDGGYYDETLRAKGLLPEHLLAEFIGLHIFKANERILELLGEALLESSKFTHSYPFCWRTHKPVIYRATKQWFILMDEKKLDGKSLRELALEQLNSVKFYPESGVKRLSSMIENRPDWCISRQRDWGVPIAFFRDKKSQEVIFDDDVLDHLVGIFEKNGADAWWDLEIKDLLPPNSKYNPNNLEKVYDILDVWFDSGSTWEAVLNSARYDAGEYQASMYLEGSDQHRGWFQSSLLISTAINHKTPYKNILTHGFTVDEKGQKMSKSKGNVVLPQNVAKNYGVEILRLWIMLSDYSTDLKISDNILKQVSEQYRKIRNTIRFLLANTNDIEFVETKNFTLLDKWILMRAKIAFEICENAFEKYEFSKGFSVLLNFLSADLSGIYLDICKDRLYCNAKDDSKRVSAQSAMVLIARKLFALLAPSLTYTIDEALEHANVAIKENAKDVFDLLNKQGFEYEYKIEDELFIKSREKFFEIIDGLKKDKIIKSTLELSLQTSANELLSEDLEEIADWFMVSVVESIDEQKALAEFKIDNIGFKIVKSSLNKCPRCWKFLAKEDGCLCPRCNGVEKAKNV